MKITIEEKKAVDKRSVYLVVKIRLVPHCSGRLDRAEDGRRGRATLDDQIENNFIIYN